jgi:hypothetical protein
LCCALFALACPRIWSNSEPTNSPQPKLTSSDYRNFQENLLTLKNQRDSYRSSLTQALQQKQIIEQMLRDETQKYNDLVASVMEHSNDSTTSSTLLLKEIQRLTQLLSASESTVEGLRQSLELVETEFDRRLQAAVGKAVRLERSVKTWRTVALVGVPVGIAGGVLIAVVVSRYVPR